MASFLGTANVADILYNKFLGLPTVNPSSATSSQAQFGSATPYVPGGNLMIQPVPNANPNDFSGSTTSVPGGGTKVASTSYPYIVKYTGVVLTSDSPLKVGVSFMYVNTDITNDPARAEATNILRNAIQNPAYPIAVFVGGVQIVTGPGTPYEFSFDADAGVLTFLAGTPSGAVTMNFYRYEGAFGSNLHTVTLGTGNVTTNRVSLLSGFDTGSNLVVTPFDSNVLTVTGNVSANIFFGNGSTLSGISLSQVTSGTGNVTTNKVSLLSGFDTGSKFVVTPSDPNVLTVAGNIVTSGLKAGVPGSNLIVNPSVSNILTVTGNIAAGNIFGTFRGDGTLLTGAVGNQNLQSVTNIGNTTTNVVQFFNGFTAGSNLTVTPFGPNVLTVTGNVTAGNIFGTFRGDGTYLTGTGGTLQSVMNLGNVVTDGYPKFTNGVKFGAFYLLNNRINSISLNDNPSGVSNTGCIAIGYGTGYGTQGQDVVAVGYQAGQTSQNSYAISMGHQSGRNGQGIYSVAIGYQSGTSAQASDAVAIGNQTAQSGQGYGSIALGFQTAASAQGSNCVAIGYQAGKLGQNTQSIAIGYETALFGQALNAIAIGPNAGNTGQSSYACAIGDNAGKTNQGNNSIAIGSSAGSDTQRSYSVALGWQAGQTVQGPQSVAIGPNAGNLNQGQYAIAVGLNAGYDTQKNFAVALGWQAGETVQGTQSIAIGPNAGNSNQGQYAIAIGANAGQTNQPDNSIVINASGTAVNGASTNAFYVSPVRSLAFGGTTLGDDSTAKEIYQYSSIDGLYTTTTTVMAPYTGVYIFSCIGGGGGGAGDFNGTKNGGNGGDSNVVVGSSVVCRAGGGIHGGGSDQGTSGGPGGIFDTSISNSFGYNGGQGGHGSGANVSGTGGGAAGGTAAGGDGAPNSSWVRAAGGNGTIPFPQSLPGAGGVGGGPPSFIGNGYAYGGGGGGYNGGNGGGGGAFSYTTQYVTYNTPIYINVGTGGNRGDTSAGAGASGACGISSYPFIQKS